MRKHYEQQVESLISELGHQDERSIFRNEHESVECSQMLNILEKTAAAMFIVIILHLISAYTGWTSTELLTGIVCYLLADMLMRKA